MHGHHRFLPSRCPSENALVAEVIAEATQNVEAALYQAREFDQSGPKYDWIHSRLWPGAHRVASIGSTLRVFSQGWGVCCLQEGLNQIQQNDATSGGAYSLLKVDGIFGQKTLNRVREFQNCNGLQADGVVGPMTRAALVSRALSAKA